MATFLDSVNGVLIRATNFIWKGVAATAGLLENLYQKGVKLTPKQRASVEQRLNRSAELPWWDITIHHKTV